MPRHGFFGIAGGLVVVVVVFGGAGVTVGLGNGAPAGTNQISMAAGSRFSP